MIDWVYSDRTLDFGHASCVAVRVGQFRQAVRVRGALTTGRKIRARCLLKEWWQRRRSTVRGPSVYAWRVRQNLRKRAARDG